MRTQIADDSGRQIRWPWLGPKGLRWPMDWTIEEWILGFMSFFVGLALLVAVIPAGAVVAGVTIALARWISRLTAPENPRTHFWAVVFAVTVLCVLLVSANPMTWVAPMFFPLAVLASFAVPFIAVRTIGGVVNWNRPIAYWVRLPRLVSRGPRRMSTDRSDPMPLALGIDLLTADLSTDLRPIPVHVITSPAKYGKSPHLPKPKSKPKREPRHRMVAKTERGFRVGQTEYHIEWRTF